MSKATYYQTLVALAAQKRAEHNVSTAKFGLREVRTIYKAESITIDYRPLRNRIRAVYMCDDGDPSVLVNNKLPQEPRIFAMVHELKHHYCDREAIEAGEIRCGDYNAHKDIEIGAEVFAAEFIYPESEFLDLTRSLGIPLGSCTEAQVVSLKRACPAKVSYKFLCKRLERLGYASKGSFDKVQFKKLEEQMYGVPFYKTPSYKASRARKASWGGSR